MFGPGAYRPDPTEGITAIADLPQPEIVPYSRNDKRNVWPRCGHVAYRDKQSQRTLHDLGNLDVWCLSLSKLSVALPALFVMRRGSAHSNHESLLSDTCTMMGWAISVSLPRPSRSLFHQRDECGFNSIQAFEYRLWVVEIALFG